MSTTKFKFFRGYVGTLNVMDGQTYATASLSNPNTLRVEVNANPLSNNEMERWYAEHVRRDEQMYNQGIVSQEQYNLNRDMFAEHERVRRRRMDNDNQIRLYQATRVTTVNPNWRTKIKMGLQELSIFFKSSPYGIMILWATSTIGAILILSKILSIW